MNIYKNLENLGLSLPEPPAIPAGLTGVKMLCENALYVSGCGCIIENKGFRGKVGTEVSLEEAKLAARDTILNFLALLEQYIGDLNRVESFVKLLVFVASSPDFFEQPAVANGATELLIDVFGLEIGCPSRSAVGVAVLPGNIAVEIEGIVKIKG